MAQWQTPKTNWTPDDFINIEDIQRIVWNIEYLAELARIVFQYIELQHMDDEKEYISQWYASEVNIVEKNLEKINELTYRFDIGETKEYRANGNYIDYAELNRIESACLRIYNTMQTQIAIMPRLAFRLGGARPLGKR